MKPIIKTACTVAAFLLASGVPVEGQEQKTWQWMNRLGGRLWDISGGVICNSKNDLFVTGSFMDTLVCHGKVIYSAGDQDVFLARFNSRGHLKDLWQFGGKERDQATCIALGRDNEVVIGGLITGDVSFNNRNLSGEGRRLFIASRSDKDDFSWISAISVSGEASLFLLDCDKTGHIFAAGVFSGMLTSGDHSVISQGGKDIFLARLSAAGVVENLLPIGGHEDDLPTAISAGDSTNIMLAGTARSSFMIGNLTISSSNRNPEKEANSNTFIVNLRKDFTPLWKIQLDANGYCQVASIQTDSLGNLYAAGSFNHNINLSDTLLVSNGYSDGFILKYGSDGQLIWSRSFGSWYYDYIDQLLVDNFGGTILTGSIGDTIIIDSLAVEPVSSSNSAFTIQFSPMGKATWADCLSGMGRSSGNGTTVDRNGNLYFTGTFRERFIKENSDLTSLGDQDVFLAKYHKCPPARAEILGETVMCRGSCTELSIRQGYQQVVWNDTIRNTNYIVASSPGLYRVRMLDKHGCVLADTVEISLAPSFSFSLGADSAVPMTSSVLLKAPLNYIGYRWQDDSGETTFRAEARDESPGTCTYWLSVTDTMGCVVRDSIRITFYSDLKWIDHEKAQLSVFPNPVDDLLYWSVTTDRPCQFIMDITDDNGRIMYSKHILNYQPDTQFTIDFSPLPPGLYYFRLKNDKGHPIKSVSLVRK